MKTDSLYANGVIQGGSYANLHREGFRTFEDDYFQISLTSLRVWDAFQTILGSASSDDLGITAGTFATGAPNITAGDVKTISGTRYARFLAVLPEKYYLRGTASLVLDAGMMTTIADGSCTLDIQVYKCALNGLVSGADLYAGSAININSLTFEERVFALTTGTLNPGDLLDVRVAIAYVDTATGTAVIPTIAAINLNCQTKG